MKLQDKIGRQDIVDKVCGLVDSLKKDQKLCLAINGAWGSGKSFVLQMIEEQLSLRQEYIIVKYDAWKNNFYSDPLIAMLYCILDTLENTAQAKDIRVENVVLDVAKDVGSAVVATVAEKSKIAGFIISAINKIKAIIKEYKKSAFTNHQALDDFRSYASFLNQTIQQLNEITSQEVYEGKQTKLIVLADEIDRCLPDEQLVVLERLHHLFDIKNCAVIVALNKEAISNTFAKNYGGESDDYLRKFFQYNFELATNETMLLKNRLIDLFYKINDKRSEVVPEKGVNFIVDDIVKVLENIILENNINNIDNRDIEKFINIGENIVMKIINTHPALLWFALQILLYRLFSIKHYKELVDLPNVNNTLIVDLRHFHRKGIKESSVQKVYNYTTAFSQSYIYKYYDKSEYNDLQFLFNLCKYRSNSQLIKSLSATIKNPMFINKTYTAIDVAEQIKSVIFELERYGE